MSGDDIWNMCEEDFDEVVDVAFGMIKRGLDAESALSMSGKIWKMKACSFYESRNRAETVLRCKKR